MNSRHKPNLLSLLTALFVAHPAYAAGPRTHTSESFQFTVAAPMSVAFPLFGADRERVWAPDWAPYFIWPDRPDDREGMVFTIAQGERQAIWVNTELDPIIGRIQYVYVLPEVMTTVITLKLLEQGSTTIVHVRYDRTALSASADEHVRELARHDASAGPEWAGQIAAFLAHRGVSTSARSP